MPAGLLFRLLSLVSIKYVHSKGEGGDVHFTSWKYFNLWKCSLHFVYIFKTEWNFLIKFCSSDPSFNGNILRSLYLKFQTSAHAHIAINYYYLLFTNFLTYEFLKLSLAYILINEVGQWFYQLDFINFIKSIPSIC